jgi:hypothetical protein
MPANLYHELVDFGLFMDAVLRVAFYTGVIVVPLVLMGYEQWKKKVS